MRLLITRPEPDAQTSAALLRARGYDVVVSPLLQIEPVPDASIDDGRWGALLMTSINAIRAIKRHPRHAQFLTTPLFTVGRRTAEAARQAGFTEVVSADGDQDDLVALITRHREKPGSPLLYLAGEDRAGDLAGVLVGHGFLVRTVTVYRAIAAERFAEPVHQAMARGTIDAVLHYSARSARAFLQCAHAGGLGNAAVKLSHYCLSAQVAAPLAASGAEHVHIARHPDEAGLFDIIRAI